MKTINFKRILSLTAFALVVNIVWAIEPVVKVTGNKKFVVSLSSVPDNARLTIKDLDGTVLYTEAILKKLGEFQKRYNMQNLPDGNYQITMDSKLKNVSFPMIVKSEKIDESSMSKTEYYKPTFTNVNNKVLVSKINLNSAPVEIIVSRNNGEVLFEETITGKNQIRKYYDFSNVFGEFNIDVNTEYDSYSHKISIR